MPPKKSESKIQKKGSQLSKSSENKIDAKQQAQKNQNSSIDAKESKKNIEKSEKGMEKNDKKGGKQQKKEIKQEKKVINRYGDVENQPVSAPPSPKKRIKTIQMISPQQIGFDNQNPMDFKGQDYLIKNTGLLEAYHQFLRSICKFGLPVGDVYEFAAQQIQKYEKRKKTKQYKIKAQLEIQKAAVKKIAKQNPHRQYEF